MKAVPFRQLHELSHRKEVATKILEKYPQRIPVILEAGASSNGIELTKRQYLVPYEVTLGRFISEVRKNISLGADRGLYIFVDNNVMLSPMSLMSELYKKYKNEDGFLYMIYSCESTFGSMSIFDN